MSLLDDMLDRQGIYVTEFPEGWKFYWRLLTVKEYAQFSALRASEMFHPFYIHWKVLERCYQGDIGLLNQKMPLGVPLSVGELILYLSGDCEAESIKDEIDLVRQMYPADSMNEVFKRIILTAYPAYKPEDLDALNRRELIHKFVHAESMLHYKTGGQYQRLDTSKILSGSEVQEEQFQQVDTRAVNMSLNEIADPWAEFDEDEDLPRPNLRKPTKQQLEKLDQRR